MLWGISRRFHRLSPWNGQVAHALRTLAPVAINKTRRFRHAAPRLACVKPAASVHPEPGSNSSLYIFLISLSCSWHFNSYCFFNKNSESTILAFIGTCCTCSSSFQSTFLSSGLFLSERDRKDRALFLSLQIFLQLFLKYFSPLSPIFAQLLDNDQYPIWKNFSGFETIPHNKINLAKTPLLRPGKFFSPHKEKLPIPSRMIAERFEKEKAGLWEIMTIFGRF